MLNLRRRIIQVKPCIQFFSLFIADLMFSDEKIAFQMTEIVIQSMKIPHIDIWKLK